MPVTAKRFYHAQPGTSNGTLFTAAAGKTTVVKEIVISNTTGTAATVTLNVVPVAGSATAANRIVAAKSIPANDLVVIALSLVMNENETLQGLQGTSGAITVTVSGVEQS